MTAPRVVSGPTLLTGICFCATCGGAMMLRTGKSGRYRYYTCCTKARQSATGCPGRTVPMDKLDTLAADYIEQRLLQPQRLEKILSAVLDRREERASERAHCRLAQTRGGGGGAAQAPLRRDRERRRRARSLVRPRDLRIELSAPFCLELPNNRHRKWGNFEGS